MYVCVFAVDLGCRMRGSQDQTYALNVLLLLTLHIL